MKTAGCQKKFEKSERRKNGTYMQVKNVSYWQNRHVPIINSATFFGECARMPQPRQLIIYSSSQSTPSSPSAYPPRTDSTRTLFSLGLISAFLSLFIVPEIFGSVAIILGAYTWKMERDDSRNRGLIVLILGIICMIVGIYFTSYFELGDLLS